jgi:hypothetical protein
MKKTIEAHHWYFVDETGDPVFYDRHGKFIVGTEGCSPILALGFVETKDPATLRQALAELHEHIAGDTYLRDIPSIEKTNRAFHAKDDAPEVRYLVYQCLAKLDFKAQFIVARKIESVFRDAFNGNEAAFYDHLISRLFTNVLHRHSHNTIFFAQRGTRTRQANLEHAIQAGIAEFESRWKSPVNTQQQVLPQVTAGEPCLQVIDYMNWAVYRAFTRREMRYFRYVESKVSLLVDLYDQAKYPKNWYNRTNRFDVEKASPL